MKANGNSNSFFDSKNQKNKMLYNSSKIEFNFSLKKLKLKENVTKSSEDLFNYSYIIKNIKPCDLCK